MIADNELDAIDHTHRLGIAKMPPGYRLLQLDTGHFIWHRESDEAESAIHWNKWVIRRWAFMDFAGITREVKDGE